MNKKETGIDGAYVIVQQKHTDERGYFSRSYCQQTMESLGLNRTIIQSSESWNNKKGTLRGMHYQSPPYEEIKLVRCLKGRLFDVILDLRKSSATYLNHFCIELAAFDGKMIYVPKGVAHGFVTLEENTVIGYSMLEGEYSPEHASGVRWNDTVFNIPWPCNPSTFSHRDANYPDYET